MQLSIPFQRCTVTNPNSTEIGLEALNATYCRCGGYARIKQAAVRAAALAQEVA